MLKLVSKVVALAGTVHDDDVDDHVANNKDQDEDAVRNKFDGADDLDDAVEYK